MTKFKGGFAGDFFPFGVDNSGNDTVSGGFGNDNLSGGLGKDTISGDSGYDILTGGAGADSINGGSGGDTIGLYSAAETLDHDTIDGGAGLDTLLVSYADKTSGLKLTIKDWIETSNVSASSTVIRVENFTITATEHADLIRGGIGEESISGGASNDTIYGGRGSDALDGGAGNDYLDGGDGLDTLSGGLGNDSILGGKDDDVIKVALGDAGKDVIDGGAGNNRLVIQDLAESFTASAGTTTLSDGTIVKNILHYTINAFSTKDMTIKTLGGDDEIIASGGKQTISTGAGDDAVSTRGDQKGTVIDGGAGVRDELSLVFASKNAIVSAAGANATVTNGATSKGFEELRLTFRGEGTNELKGSGSSADISVFGGAGIEKIVTGSGDDYVTDSDGKTSAIDTGAGNDALTLGDSSRDQAGMDVTTFTVNTGAGDDHLFWRGGKDKLNLDLGAGVLDRVSLDFWAYTTAITYTVAAAVTIKGQGGVVKGAEQVTLYGGSGNDRFTGGAGIDVLNGGDGKDVLKGMGGDDVLTGGAGRDDMDGGVGNDLVNASFGDTAKGGAGTDILHFDASTSSNNFKLTFSTGANKIDSKSTASGFEQLHWIGGKGVDDITGGAKDDRIAGGDGNDVLKGLGGNDVLISDNGNDKLYGGAGDDFLVRSGTGVLGTDKYDGGSGKDTVYFDVDTSVVFDLAAQSKNDGAAKGLTVANIENVTGGNRDDRLYGDKSANILSGGGNDDILQGRDGNDILEGGYGDDVLTGGSGADKFVFGYAFRDGDTITDFKRGSDKLVIVRDGFSLETGSITVTTGADPVASGNKPVFLFETDSHRLWFDADGALGARTSVLIATLDKVSTLSKSDFLLVDESPVPAMEQGYFDYG